MKDVRAWIEKSRLALESPQNKKRPLRDQLTLREKMASDINVQKTKISISVDKLQVYINFICVFNLCSIYGLLISMS